MYASYGGGGGLLYASYDRGPIVRQLWWGGAYCTPVMIGDLLYASYDEGTYCTPVMVGGACYVLEEQSNKTMMNTTVVFTPQLSFLLP